jgi:hypothetical protein
MPTPYESAKLILQIFEMRREPVLREARLWFVRDFNPETIDDVKAALAGPHNPHARMVVGALHIYSSFSPSLCAGSGVYVQDGHSPTFGNSITVVAVPTVGTLSLFFLAATAIAVTSARDMLFLYPISNIA